MIRPDIVVTQPQHMDFPIFRYRMEKLRPYYNELYLALSNHHHPLTITDFLKEQMPWAKFVNPQQRFNDWRQNAIREVLDFHSKAEWVLFLEQDFLLRDERVFEVVLNDPTPEFSVVTYTELERIHPSFLLAPRALINQTSLDFAAAPPNYDHFGKFTRELLALTTPTDITELGLETPTDFYHMAGLTNNYEKFETDQYLYKQDEFLAYNHYTRLLPIPQQPTLMELYSAIKKKYGHGAMYSYIKEFFPREIREKL